MMKARTLSLAALGLLLTIGCAKPKDTTPPPTDEAAKPAEPAPGGGPSERPALTDADCKAKGGALVGDIGDGAIHSPDYRCESGQPPIGTIRAEEGAPVAIEGAVCCPVSS